MKTREAKSKPLSLIVAVAQMKFRPSLQENVAWIIDTITSSAKAGAGAILFPECAVTGYNQNFSTIVSSEIDSACASISQAARKANCDVLVGCPTFAGRKRFNSLLVFDRRGREIFCYSKIHITSRDAQYFQPGNKL